MIYAFFCFSLSLFKIMQLFSKQGSFVPSMVNTNLINVKNTIHLEESSTEHNVFMSMNDHSTLPCLLEKVKHLKV